MQIDRIMEAFASQYCMQNPELFDEPDMFFLKRIIALQTSGRGLSVLPLHRGLRFAALRA